LPDSNALQQLCTSSENYFATVNQRVIRVRLGYKVVVSAPRDDDFPHVVM
jgi:hypothetical protein